MKNIKELHRANCGRESLNLSFTHVTCMDSTTKAEFLEIRDKITSLLVYIKDLPNIDDVIPAICCGTDKLLDDSRKDFVRICRGKARPDTPQFAVNLINSIISDATDIMCGKFSTLGVCVVERPVLAEGILHVLSNYSRHDFSVVVPLLEVIQRLDGKINED